MQCNAIQYRTEQYSTIQYKYKTRQDNTLENSRKKALPLIGWKSCLYNSMETQN